MGSTGTARQHDKLLSELTEERAAALLRISRTLESLIAELQAAGERVRQAGEGERDAARQAYRALRARALEYRWYLEVQREALGLRHHHLLDEFYRIPGAEPV